MRISDWSSDVCSSDLAGIALGQRCGDAERARHRNDLVGADLLEQAHRRDVAGGSEGALEANRRGIGAARILGTIAAGFDRPVVDLVLWLPPVAQRGEIDEELEGRARLADRKSTRLTSSHYCASRMPSSA